jgi:hypothetical protein
MKLTHTILCAALASGAYCAAPARCEAQTPAPGAYEDGTLLQASGPAVYVVVLGQRRWINSAQAFTSMGFDWNAITHVPDAALNAVPLGAPVARIADLYPEDTLLKSADRPHVYVIHGGRRQHVANEATFNALHLDWGRVRTVPRALLERIPEGPPIAVESAPAPAPGPSGAALVGARGLVFRPGATPPSLGVNAPHGATAWAVTLAASAGPSPALDALARDARTQHVVVNVGDAGCTPAVGGRYPRTVPGGGSAQVATVLFNSRADAQGFADAMVHTPLRVGRVRVMCAD